LRSLNFKQAWCAIAEKYRKMKMASNGNKDPIENLMDKFRSLLGLRTPRKKMPCPLRLVSASGIS
jgi:hypothetical protein